MYCYGTDIFHLYNREKALTRKQFEPNKGNVKYRMNQGKYKPILLKSYNDQRHNYMYCFFNLKLHRCAFYVYDEKKETIEIV